MSETEVQDYNKELQKMFGNQNKSQLNAENSSESKIIPTVQQLESDNEEFITQSPFRFSDPTVIDRKRIIGFEKTGQLLRRIKRELSTKNFDKDSQQSRQTNKKTSTQHSICLKNISRVNWNENENEKDQMEQAIVNDYEKQILTLKAQIEDTKEDKKQMKQTLQNERRFFMAQMYNKEIIIEENECQIERLKNQIEKHVSLQYKLQQKIRLLQLENSQYKYQLQGLLASEDQILPIDEENQDFLNDLLDENLPKKKKSSKLFASLGEGFGGSNFIQQDNPLQIIKASHQREIERYQKQIKNIKQFYEIKLRSLRNSITPKAPQKKRVSINILDQYVCRDSLSYQSKAPQNLRSILRQQMNFEKSGRKIDDQESCFTAKYFKYPQNTKKNINEEDIFIRQYENHQKNEISKVQFKQQSKLKQHIKCFIPSNEFLKGFGIGGLLFGISATLVYRKFSAN